MPANRNRRPGNPGRWAASGAGPGLVVCGALLLLLGLFGGNAANAAQAAESATAAGPDPRSAVSGVAGELAAVSPDAAQEVCSLLSQSTPAGTSAAPAGAAGLLDGIFTGFSDDAPTGAEPPPPQLVAPANAPNAPNGLNGLNAPNTAATATSAAYAAAAAAAEATAATAAPEPAEPLPSLAFDASLGVPPTRYGKLIYQIASRYSLNPLLVAALVEVESDFNPRARSRKGACGLMQLLPATARRFGVARRRDLFNPKKNLEVGSRYLRWLIDRFGADPVRVLAAYNAGEGAVDRFGGVPPFAETRDYVTRIFAELGFSVLLDPPVALAPLVTAVDSIAGTK
jgi:soluble lytic murein transglycosylase-like protein